MEKRRNAGAASRQQQEKGATWVGWLTGSNAKAGAITASEATAATADTADVAAVSPEEWKRFEDLLASQVRSNGSCDQFKNSKIQIAAHVSISVIGVP